MAILLMSTVPHGSRQAPHSQVTDSMSWLTIQPPPSTRSWPGQHGRHRGSDSRIRNANIYFDFDKFSLSPEVRRLCGQARPAGRPPIWPWRSRAIDERGTLEYNSPWANAGPRLPRDFLVSGGIAAERIATISYERSRLIPAMTKRPGPEPQRPLRHHQQIKPHRPLNSVCRPRPAFVQGEPA